MRLTGPAAGLGVVVVAAAAVRIWLGSRIETPFVFIDELLHAELAESVATEGRFAVRGEPVAASYVYPLAIAPAWWAEATTTAYTAAKAINAVVMTLGAIPLYLLARRLVAPVWALAATALVLLSPWFALTGTLLLENAYFPAFCLAALAFVCALERPTVVRQLLALGAVALASATRFQGLLLLAVLVTAVLVHAVLSARAGALAGLRRWGLSLAVVSVAAAVFVAVRAARGDAIMPSLPLYEGHRGADYSVSELARWLLYNAGELTISVAIVPVSALVVLVALAARRGAPTTAAERAFLAVAASAVVWHLVLAAAAASWEPRGIKERYAFYAAPLLLLALVVWLQRGLPRPRVAAAAAVVVPAGLVTALPLERLFAEPSFAGNAFSLFPLEELSRRLPGGAETVTLLLGVAAIVGGAAFVLAPRRAARIALPAAVAAFLLVASRSVGTDLEARSRGVKELAGLDGGLRWVDDAIGTRERAAFLNATAFTIESRLGDWWPTWVPVWQTEFWNRSFETVISLGLREPAPLHQPDATLDWASGRITLVGGEAPDVPFAIADRRYRVAGRPLARSGSLALYRASPPLRLASALEGVYPDGRIEQAAAYDRWPDGRRAPRAVEVTLARAAAATRVRVTAGPLVAPGNLPATGSLVASSELAVPDGATRRVRIRVPPPPFRVGVQTEAGGFVDFRELP